MNTSVLTIGDAFEDVLVSPEDLKVRPDNTFASGKAVSFELGEKIPLSDVQYEIGGSACNTAVGFSRLGIRSSILTVLGDDTPAEKILERLNNEDVSIKNIIFDKNLKSNFSIIFRLTQGRSIFIYHSLKDYSCYRIKKNMIPKWIFLGPTGEGVEDLHKDIVATVAEKNTRLGWNPGALQIKDGAQKFSNLLKNTHVLFLNREEAIKFVKFPVHPSEDEVIKRLHSLGPKIVVITAGKRGATAFDGENLYKVSVIPHVERVDSTGAGDSFAVGFLGKLMHEHEVAQESEALIEEALKWGIVNSNSVITKIGAQAGLLSTAEIKDGMKAFR
jgi:sugar/nucleoside kinase (ribokinase family)